MSFVKHYLLGIILVALNFAPPAVLYNRMPDLIPTHWNIHGVADGFTPKPFGPFLLPLISLVLFGVLVSLPRLSPKGFDMSRFSRVYSTIVAAVLGLLLVTQCFACAASIGLQLDPCTWIAAATGLLFVVLGNFLSKVTRNFFVGIRTPWTLANEEVWLRTHRLGARLFVLAGVLTLAATPFHAGVIMLVLTSLGCAGVCVVYSYVIYRRLESDAPAGG